MQQRTDNQLESVVACAIRSIIEKGGTDLKGLLSNQQQEVSLTAWLWVYEELLDNQDASVRQIAKERMAFLKRILDSNETDWPRY